MLFSSEIFLFLFLPFMLFVYYGLLFRWRSLQNLFLLGMSLLFYAYGEPWFVLVMVTSILANWIFGLLVEKFRENRTAGRGILIAMLVVNLGILGYFKYWMFFLGNINYFIGSYIPIPQITLPIGISFFTFQAISYVMDIYRGKGKAQKNPCNVGLYIAFFPQLIAGPIVRYETIAEQIHGRRESLDDFSEGACRFIVGLSKKMLLANTMALVADAAFEMAPTDRCVLMAWMGALAYTFQIYFDFSGYSDMAIGLGKMFGFHFLENFQYPYVSRSVSEFWRRWHMSLSSFFRDYVYIPLGGNRVNNARLILNLFVVWALTGLWHGANWTFIGWGLFYFVLLVFEKYTGFEKRGNSSFLLPLKHLYTILAFVLGWVLFRAENIAAAGTYFQTLFGLAGTPFFNDFVVFYFHESRYFFAFAVLFSMPVVPWLEKRWGGRACFEMLRVLAYCALFFVSVVYVVQGGRNPFIYFNF
ncbi:MAG: MBOAT family O-acyltransferase [Planctomycetia bacterium]|nr:MBOAT family O-acyltransferase [Planctomycetia bacterium]